MHITLLALTALAFLGSKPSDARTLYFGFGDIWGGIKKVGNWVLSGGNTGPAYPEGWGPGPQGAGGGGGPTQQGTGRGDDFWQPGSDQFDIGDAWNIGQDIYGIYSGYQGYKQSKEDSARSRFLADDAIRRANANEERAQEAWAANQGLRDEFRRATLNFGDRSNPFFNAYTDAGPPPGAGPGPGAGGSGTPAEIVNTAIQNEMGNQGGPNSPPGPQWEGGLIGMALEEARRQQREEEDRLAAAGGASGGSFNNAAASVAGR